VKRRPLDRCWQPPAALALLALLLALGAWAVLGLRLQGYQWLAHPFALPGARGLPGAGVFNALVFVLPGLMMGALADAVRRQLPAHAGFGVRIGCALALLAALGWIGQGVWPLDLQQLDHGDSRWHALAWSAWWISATCAAALLALAVPGIRGWGVVLVVMLLLPGVLLPAGSALAVLAQPLSLLVWAGWMRALARVLAAPG